MIDPVIHCQNCHRLWLIRSPGALQEGSGSATNVNWISPAPEKGLVPLFPKHSNGRYSFPQRERSSEWVQARKGLPRPANDASTASCSKRSLISHRMAKAKRKYRKPSHHAPPWCLSSLCSRTSTNTIALANLIGRNGFIWWRIVLINGQPHYAHHSIYIYTYIYICY